MAHKGIFDVLCTISGKTEQLLTPQPTTTELLLPAKSATTIWMENNISSTLTCFRPIPVHTTQLNETIVTLLLLLL
jgi:hypothetical protein